MVKPFFIVLLLAASPMSQDATGGGKPFSVTAPTYVQLKSLATAADAAMKCKNRAKCGLLALPRVILT